MTTVAESITWNTHEAALKGYLDITSEAEDSRLRLWLGSAAKAADHYIGTRVSAEELEAARAFPSAYNFDPTAPWGRKSLYTGEVPEEVALGCFEWVKAARATWGRSFGLTSVKTGDLSESYGISGGIVGPKQFTEAAAGYWWPFKRYITL